MRDERREKYLQTRYRRELERFLNRLVNFCRSKKKDVTFEVYVANIAARLEETEKSVLHQDYYKRLESFVNKALMLTQKRESCEQKCEAILKEANQIRKSRRIRSYNRKAKEQKGEEF